MNKRSAFFISDSTGITAQTLGQSLLSQFDHIEFKTVLVPYVDDIEKARNVVERINRAAEEDGLQPLIFDTIINPDIRSILETSAGYIVDVLTTFLKPLEQVLDTQSSYNVGKSHGKVTDESYKNRIDAVHYALDNDDGSRINQYDKADLILLGVSRTGKTPTSLYLSLQFGVYVANYPITEEDLEDNRLPKCLVPFRNRLFGLTIEPDRLSAIRNERKPNSRYSSLQQCQQEVAAVEQMYRRFDIPFIDTTQFSVEEIATRILHVMGIERCS